MAENKTRREALELALEIAEFCDEMFCEDFPDTVDSILAAAERIAGWLSADDHTPASLVMVIGPVTEQ